MSFEPGDTKAHSQDGPCDLSHHFSRATRKRVPNVLKEYYKFLRTPGMGNFAGGLPFSGNFPFEGLSLPVLDPGRLSNPDSSLVEHESSPLHIQIPRRSANQDSVRSIDLDSALQYGSAKGYPALYAWLRKLVNEVYHPNIPYRGKADVMIDSGSADGLWKIYELLFNPWDQHSNDIREREGLMIEEFVYAPPLLQVKPKDINIIPIKMDQQGMLAYGSGSMFEALDSWDTEKGKRPHVVYLIPTGQNPTSGVLSFARRREIYEVCSRFDVIIIEDDPYWNLYYPSAMKKSATCNGGEASSDFTSDDRHNYCTDSPKGHSTGYRFLDELIPSFLSLDTDGRVIRLDSFSKTIAPGCRLGWITAQPSVCEQLFRITDSTTQHPSSLAQAVITQLIADFQPDDHIASLSGPSPGSSTVWGLDGWVRWLEGLRSAYERRMIKMATMLEANRFIMLGSDQVEMFTFTWPKGGMFLWLCVNILRHPLASSVTPSRLMKALWIFCTQPPHLVLTVPGGDFAATEAIKEAHGYTYLRFCFAAVDEELLESKTRSFTDACRSFWALRRIEDIHEILHGGGGKGPSHQDSSEDDDADREKIGDW